MKNMFKTLLGVAVAAFMLQSADAATYNLTLTGSGTTNTAAIANASVKVTRIVISSGDAAAKSFDFIDAPSTSATYSRGAYTTIVQYATNYVSTFTNFSGIIQTNTNAAYFTQALSVDAATTARVKRLSVNVAAGTTYTYSDDDGIWFNFGLLITNQLITNSTITITYIPN